MTINQRGRHTVSVLITGHKKNRLTVCLAVKADEMKMKPYIVIPGKKVKEELKSIPGVIVAASVNGWMNEELTANWIDRVWSNFVYTKHMLIWDSFKCYISDDAKD